MDRKRQEACETLISILKDYLYDGGWTSEPQARKAAYCWAALHGQFPGDDW